MNIHLYRLLITLLGVCILGGLGTVGWFGLCALWRRTSGWAQLTQRFPMREIHKLGEKYSGQSGAFYRPGRRMFAMNYGISLEFAQEGIVVKAIFAPKAPLLICWQDIFRVEQINIFGSQNAAILAHYDEETVTKTNFVRFSMPPTSLVTVMKHVSIELFHQTNSLSGLIEDRLNSARKPPGNL